MSLSCECGDNYDRFYLSPNDYKIIDEDKKCISCKETIKAGDLILEFECFVMDDDDNEVKEDSEFMCETCGDIYYSLEELGFCVNIGYSMFDLLSEYHDVYLSQ